MEARQKAIIRELGTRPAITPEEEITARVHFLADYLAATGLRGFALGISGGQDSLLAGILAKRAVEKCRTNGADAAFHALLLPYGEQHDRSDALRACEFIQPDEVHDINIKPMVDAFADSFHASESRVIRDFDKGNVKARARMIAQYAIASDQQLLVIGTDHAAEAITGFYTKYGDGGADILPLAGLSKRQGRQLLETLKAPDALIEKVPTADLLDETPGQADEAELGLSYITIDDYLEGRPVSPEVATRLEYRYATTAHKRTMPVAYKSTVK